MGMPFERSVEQKKSMEYLDGAANGGPIMARAIGERQMICQSLGAPRARIAQAELLGVFAQSLFDFHGPLTGASCLYVSKHTSDRVITCIPSIKKTLYALIAEVYGYAMTGPKAFRLKTEASARPDFRAVEADIQPLASLAFANRMAFPGFLVNAERISPSRRVGVVENLLDSLDQFPGDMFFFRACEISGLKCCIAQSQERMYTTNEDVGVRFAVGRRAGWLIVGPSSHFLSLRAMDSATRSIASSLACVSVHWNLCIGLRMQV